MKCDELESFTAETFGDGKCEMYEAVEVDAAIAELKQKLEDAKASHYAEMVDAGMRERRLKRALWIARAERAKDRKYKYETWERNERKKFNWDGDLIAIVSIKARKWRSVEIKCIKKAEEYK